MAVVRQRRQLNLQLPLPESDRCPHLDRLQVLGHENGGTVYKVCHKRTDKIFALKVVHGESDSTLCRQVFREMEILRRIDSPFIVQCHGVFEKPSGDIAMVMEYMTPALSKHYCKKRGLSLKKNSHAWFLALTV
ncbi:hypothetical protein Pint_36419 [Pistacia integerrima]|uniref:Uncharacterized protein n=1 Tax=Pistacia integerrima TaxID=434235 RepID=A0ACC0Y4M6_9ROSI|nr:hypothetical protein Pint_36419 [Pistacia integerrima]